MWLCFWIQKRTPCAIGTIRFLNTSQFLDPLVLWLVICDLWLVTYDLGWGLSFGQAEKPKSRDDRTPVSAFFAVLSLWKAKNERPKSRKLAFPTCRFGFLGWHWKAEIVFGLSKSDFGKSERPNFLRLFKIFHRKGIYNVNLLFGYFSYFNIDSCNY